jgi:hypothetical protein
VCLICNAIDLALAQEWHSVKGDGTSDHEIMNGIQEFYAFVHEITDMNGNRKSIGIDGFLKSWGLTAEAERDTCLEIIKVLRHVLTVAKKRFAKKFAEETEEQAAERVAGACFLGNKTDVNNIGLMWYHHFGADGAAAAQKWARLNGRAEREGA